MIDVKKIAKYIVSYYSSIGDCDLTHMKLQKLLYYVQVEYLKYVEKAAFKDEIEAWEHGPVVRSIYEEYLKYKRSVIEIPEEERIYTLDSKNILDIVNKIIAEKGKYNASVLRNMTHEEKAWKLAYVDGEKRIISIKNISEHLDRKRDSLDLEAIEDAEDLMLCLNSEKEQKKDSTTYTWEEIKTANGL